MARSSSFYLQKTRRILVRNARLISLVAFFTLLEIYLHIRSFSIPRPSEPLDPPFASSCRPAGFSSTFDPHGRDAPPDAHLGRENATIMMLARNSDLDGAATAVRSLENQWNRHFNYPYTFLNDKPFSDDFIQALRKEVSGQAVFEQIPSEMWTWPAEDVVNRDGARRAMHRMAEKGLPYADNENYHHMCRFYSGFFYDHPALQQYNWYWRLEPDVQYTCAIPYDPFKRMRESKKKYGYVIALWEVGSTSPTLFRTALNHMKRASIGEGTMWRSLIEPSTAPLPIRWGLMSLQSLFHSRTSGGDPWSLCHFWSNFEIADLSFFRSQEYRDFFRTLDEAGGFYTERWGDAPVHSLGAAMFLQPEELHWFSDFGYVHPPLQHCPTEHAGKDAGCGCQCGTEKLGMRGVPADCVKSLRRAVEPS